MVATSSGMLVVPIEAVVAVTSLTLVGRPGGDGGRMVVVVVVDNDTGRWGWGGGGGGATAPTMTMTWPPAHGTISPPSQSSVSMPTQVCLFHIFFFTTAALQ